MGEKPHKRRGALGAWDAWQKLSRRHCHRQGCCHRQEYLREMFWPLSALWPAESGQLTDCSPDKCSHMQTTGPTGTALAVIQSRAGQRVRIEMRQTGLVPMHNRHFFFFHKILHLGTALSARNQLCYSPHFFPLMLLYVQVLRHNSINICEVFIICNVMKDSSSGN